MLIKILIWDLSMMCKELLLKKLGLTMNQEKIKHLVILEILKFECLMHQIKKYIQAKVELKQTKLLLPQNTLQSKH
jgi:hypothetical protein